MTTTIDPDRATGSDHDAIFDVEPRILDGDRVVEKSATGTNRSVVRREASVLAQLDAGYTVRLLSVTETDDRTTMTTLDAGSRTLADTSRMGAGEMLKALCASVEVIRCLRAAGWEHGSIAPEHIVVGARGRVRLCSLGAARPLPAASLGECTDTAEHSNKDVTALIGVTVDVAAQPIREDRWSERRRRLAIHRRIGDAGVAAENVLRLSGSAVDALECLAQRLTALQESYQRPQPVGINSTRRVRRRRATAAPASGTRPRRRHGSHDRRPSRDTAAGRSIPAVLLVVVAVVVGVLALRSTATSDASEAAPPPGTVEHGDTAAVDTARTINDAGPRPDATAGPHVTPQPDSAPEPDLGPSPDSSAAANGSIGPADGLTDDRNVIVLDGIRFVLGAAGDVALAGRWFCSEASTALLLRPATGEVFQFEEWATADKPTTGRLVAIRAGAIGMHARTSECETPILNMGDGPDVPLTEAELVGTR